MNKHTIFIEAPAIIIERIDGVKLKTEGEITVEHEIQFPNPNLDFYYDMENVADMVRTTYEINGKEVELDWRAATVDLNLRADDVIESAEIRAAEDCTTREKVLEDWGRRAKIDCGVIHGTGF